MFTYFSIEELRFIQTPPLRITTQVHDLLFLQCEAGYDELLDVAYIWKHNGETLRNNHDGTERIVSTKITVYIVLMSFNSLYPFRLLTIID